MAVQFSIFLVIIFLTEIGIGIAGYVMHGQLKTLMADGFNSTMNDYEHHTLEWKLLQAELECCGANGPTDWQQHNITLPAVCCKELPADQKDCDLQHAFVEGCMPKLLHEFESKSLILAAVGVGVALIQVRFVKVLLRILVIILYLFFCILFRALQLIGVAYACCLVRAFRRNYETV